MQKLTKPLILLFWILPLSSIAQDLNELEKKDPFVFSGGVDVRGIFYNASGIPNRRDPFTWIISGSPTISLYGWSIPFSFVFSKDERAFRQPFNQYGLSPTYKWLTVHAGYRNVSFSPFTLDGHTMLGAGFEARPKKFRLGFMYGRLNKATVIDTAREALVPYSFDRKGWAAKVGYGTQKNYFDLNFFRAIDDTANRPALNNFINDGNKVLPQSNSIVGYGTRWQLLKRLVFESDGAVSLYTYDIGTSIDPTYMVEKKWQPWAKRLNVNGTSEWAIAVSGALGYQQKNWGLKIGYRRVEPGFFSMGAWYIPNDLENWTVSPNFTLRNGKMRVSGSLGLQHDNLRHQKQATNSRIIGAGTLSAEIAKNLGIDANYSNFSNNQKPNTLKFADSLKIVQTTQSLTVIPRYTIPGENVYHTIFLIGGLNTMKDFSNYYSATSTNRNINTQQFSANYNISFPKRSLNLFTALTYTKMDAANNTTSYSGVSLGGTYALFNNKLQTGVNTSLMKSSSKITGNGNIINATFNAGYAITKAQMLRAMLFLTKNNPGTAISGGYPAFSETRAELAYQVNFSLGNKKNKN